MGFVVSTARFHVSKKKKKKQNPQLNLGPCSDGDNLMKAVDLFGCLKTVD